MKKVIRLAQANYDKINQAAAVMGMSFQSFAICVLMYASKKILMDTDKSDFEVEDPERKDGCHVQK